jgi:hypothetical protein
MMAAEVLVDEADSNVSIHAPRVGSDGYVPADTKEEVVFQSTLPAWGATFESMQSCGQVMLLRLLSRELGSVESLDANGGMHLRAFRSVRGRERRGSAGLSDERVLALDG